jgi:hypothetical protein
MTKHGHGKANWGDLKDELAMGESSLPTSTEPTAGGSSIVKVPSGEKTSEIPESAKPEEEEKLEKDIVPDEVKEEPEANQMTL